MRVHLHLPSPLGVRVINAVDDAPLSDLIPELGGSYFMRTRSAILPPSTLIRSLAHASSPDFPVDVHVCARLLGGKGGFGANLRAAGGRMNASKSTNFDSCRDLNGRRLGTLKEAQKQAELLESLPSLQAKAAAEDKAKLESIERRLGVSSEDKDGGKRLAEVDLEELARKKHKFDDTQFFEESREIKENVRSAVSAALLKKKKKTAAKKDAPTAPVSKAKVPGPTPVKVKPTEAKVAAVA